VKEKINLRENIKILIKEGRNKIKNKYKIFIYFQNFSKIINNLPPNNAISYSTPSKRYQQIQQYCWTSWHSASIDCCPPVSTTRTTPTKQNSATENNRSWIRKSRIERKSQPLWRQGESQRQDRPDQQKWYSDQKANSCWWVWVGFWSNIQQNWVCCKRIRY